MYVVSIDCCMCGTYSWTKLQQISLNSQIIRYYIFVSHFTVIANRMSWLLFKVDVSLGFLCLLIMSWNLKRRTNISACMKHRCMSCKLMKLLWFYVDAFFFFSIHMYIFNDRYEFSSLNSLNSLNWLDVNGCNVLHTITSPS